VLRDSTNTKMEGILFYIERLGHLKMGALKDGGTERWGHIKMGALKDGGT
jgi:hypothetical protein